MGPHLASRTLLLLGAVLLGAAQLPAAQNRVIYVNHAATGANDGSSWADAFVHPRPALAVAVQGDEIWVAKGIYPTSLSGNPQEVLRISSALRLFGGFSGTETSRTQRDPRLHRTVLTGRLPGGGRAHHVLTVGHRDPGMARIDGFELRDATAPKRGGGVLIYGGGLILADCFLHDLVANGFSTGDGRGAAVGSYADFTRLRAERCVFEDNWAEHGGAIWIGTGLLELEDCEFRRNSHRPDLLTGYVYQSQGSLVIRRGVFEDSPNTAVSFYGSAGSFRVSGATFRDNVGGALSLQGSGEVRDCQFLQNGGFGRFEFGAITTGFDAQLSVIGCRFEGNMSDNAGAAILHSGYQYPIGGGLEVDRCTFVRNTSVDPGGAVAFSGWRLRITNSLFQENSAPSGSALFVDAPASSDSLVMNCTFVDNLATADGSAVKVVANARFPRNQTRFLNCIFWGNRTQAGVMNEWKQLDGKARAAFCAIQNHHYRSGFGHTGAAPQFVNPGAGDFHLLPSSPLIDAGYPFSGRVMPPRHNLDFDGEWRLHGAAVDIGADEVW